MKTLYIVRSNDFVNYFRSYGIYANEKKIGEIRSGESKTFETSDDLSEIYCKIDWCRSNKLQINSEEKNINLKISAFKYSNLFVIISSILLILSFLSASFTEFEYWKFVAFPILIIMIFSITFGKNNYLNLEKK